MNKKQFTFLVIIWILGWIGVRALLLQNNAGTIALAIWGGVANALFTVYLGINLFHMLGDKNEHSS